MSAARLVWLPDEEEQQQDHGVHGEAQREEQQKADDPRSVSPPRGVHGRIIARAVAS